MPIKTIEENPTTTDTIKLVITTTDSNDDAVDPYMVDKITIYFVERLYSSGNLNTQEVVIDSTTTQNVFYDNARAIKTFGSEDFPAWLSTDTDNAMVEKDDTEVGKFYLYWTPESREGDYIVCWTWTVNPGDSKSATYYDFHIEADTTATTSIPTHSTNKEKYNILLSNYLANMFKLKLRDGDLTPDVLERYNLACAKLYTQIEDMVNQLVDLLDANVVSESFLPYIANMFAIKLRSQDSTLWRRQIKTAIPLYKKKGTLGGLREALAADGITLNRFSMYWQVVSSTTWQESFIADGISKEFTLMRTAIISPLDSNNFELWLRPKDTNSYISQPLSYVEFANEDDITTMTWVGDIVGSTNISEGDIVRIIYKVDEPSDQTIEDYIRTLPLADNRDETTITTPYKNWNVRLIAEDDSMFSQICKIMHPYVDPLVFGKIRTEFPFSENIYNMEEYNGSLRDSKNPCDIDKNFIDDCSCCQSSSFIIELEVEKISDDRIKEASDIINEYKPFHLTASSIVYSSKLSEFILPPIETITILTTMRIKDITLSNVETVFNRSMALPTGMSLLANTIDRNALTDESIIVSNESGNIRNENIILFSLNARFNNLPIDNDSNVLEILSGANAGEYTVEKLGKNVVVVNQSSPDTISFPLNTSEFSFNISNIKYEDSSASIYQDNKFVLSDENVKLYIEPIETGTTPWKVEITSGSNQGTFDILEVLPDNTLVVDSWTGSTTESGLSWELQTNNGTSVLTSDSGVITVVERGNVVFNDNKDGFSLLAGDYVLYNGNQYLVLDFINDTSCYISNYSGGNVVGSASIKFYERIIDNSKGFLDLQGLVLTTASDYESSLSIIDGESSTSIDGESDDNNRKSNYIIVINDDTYKILKWDGDEIYLSGSPIPTNLTNSSIDYSIIYLEKNEITISGVDFYKIDRNGNDVYVLSQETSTSFTSLTSPSKGPSDTTTQKERIWFEIERKDNA